MQRSEHLASHGGAWVFPGGRIDAKDHAASGGDIVAAARAAAVREAREEAGVIVAPERLVLFSRWITPEPAPKRFDTWFFAAACDDECVRVDGAEIRAFRWLSPAAALAAQQAGQIDLPPPTFVTLTQLNGRGGVQSTLAALRRRPMETFVPRLGMAADSPCTLYAGDVAYEDGDTTKPGPRHRLVLSAAGWKYERTAR